VNAAARTIADLQRELLAICRGGSYLATWAFVNGVSPSDAADLAGSVKRAHRVHQLRVEILGLNPDAALYFGWAPGDDTVDEDEFRARHALHRRQADQLERAEHTSLYGDEHGSREVLA
jgi:hypothetical protein